MFFWYLVIVIYFVFYLPTILKQLIVWLYLWQRKEYRGDKMMDYLSLPEGKKVLFDKFTLIRLSIIVIALLSGLLQTYFQISNSNLNPSFSFWLNTIELTILCVLTTSWLVESGFYFYRFQKKQIIQKPELTSKALLIFVLSWITLIFGPLFIKSSLNLSIFFNTIFADFLLFSFFILLTPIIIGFWLLILFPLDYYLKSKYFQRARTKRQSYKDLKVIAISGAYGKTTTKDILFQLLDTKYRVEKTLKNQNSNMSCALKMINLNPDTEYFLCELGAYRRGDGSEICQFVFPNCSIITGLNYQHYSLFGSEEKIILSESESLNFLDKGDTVAINWSSQLCHKISIPEGLKVIKYGIVRDKEDSKDFEIYAKDISFDGKLTSFTLSFKDKKKKTIKLKTNLYSFGNIENLVGALSLCLNFGLKIDYLTEALLKLTPPHGALYLEKNSWGLALDDSYNANFDGVRNAIEFTYEYKEKKKSDLKKVLILDDILELGKKSIEIHQNVAQSILENPPDLVILQGRNFGKIISDYLILNKYKKTQVIFWNETNHKEVLKKLQNYLKKNKSLVLFEGYQSRKILKELG